MSADDFKKQATSNGRLLNPQYGHVILVSERRVPLKLSKHSLSADVTGLEIATDTVANATNIFSLATKNSGLVAKVATRF